VEERAIGTDQRGDYVLVVDDQNIVHDRRVKLGIAVEGGMRVVEEGIEASDQVIVNGLQLARPTQPVTIANPSAIEKTASDAETAASDGATSDDTAEVTMATEGAR